LRVFNYSLISFERVAQTVISDIIYSRYTQDLYAFYIV